MIESNFLSRQLSRSLSARQQYQYCCQQDEHQRYSLAKDIRKLYMRIKHCNRYQVFV